MDTWFAVTSARKCWIASVYHILYRGVKIIIFKGCGCSQSHFMWLQSVNYNNYHYQWWGDTDRLPLKSYRYYCILSILLWFYKLTSGPQGDVYRQSRSILKFGVGRSDIVLFYICVLPTSIFQFLHILELSNSIL